MPVGIPTLVNLTIPEFLENHFFGFLEVTVEAPLFNTDAGYIGLLPSKIRGRLLCPGGIFTGWYFSEEPRSWDSPGPRLRFALKHGYRLISIKQAYSFQLGVNTFLGLIKDLNQMKIDAQEQGLPTIRNIAKLLMNSMSGRFGMHTEAVKHVLINPNELVNISKNFQILDEIPLGRLYLVTLALNQPNPIIGNKINTKIQKFLEGVPGNTNVAIAAAVTAYSRMIINQYKLKALEQGLDIYYSDTDSIVLNGALPENLVDSAILGKFKLEHTLVLDCPKARAIKEGIFVMPKVYYLETTEGRVITKCKGFSAKLNKAQYLELLKGNSLELTTTRWYRDLRNSTVQIQKGTPYTINFSLNKRNQVFENGIWVNTTPIILNL